MLFYGTGLDELVYALGLEDRKEGGGGIAKKRNEWLSNLGGGITEAVLGEVGKEIKTGIEKADLGSLVGDALNPVESKLAQFKLELLKGFQSFGDEIAKSWSKADQAAYDYAKQVGMSEKAIESFRDGIINMSGAVTEVGNLYGKTFEDLLKLQSKFSEELGRSVRFSTEQIRDVAAMGGIIGDDMAVKFAAQMETFGMSTSAAGEMVAKMYGDSVKKGITLQAYSKNVSENLHLAQQYTFKNGVQGLMSMAENAAKMKMDMQQVVSLGNKLAEGGVEGAVNMAAELQVLGGAFAQFADPLGLLHDSLLGMDDLSERLTGLIGEMGSFDKQQGKVVIDPFQQMQLRQAAKSMGLDYGKLIDSATQQAKRKEIETQMSGLSNIPDEYKEMIMNTAQFDKNGNAGITLADGSFKNISELTKRELVEIADLEKDLGTDVKEIKKFLIGAEDARKNQEAALENQRAIDNQTQAKEVKSVYQALGENQKALQEIVHWQKISAMYAQIQTIRNMGAGIFSMFKSVTKLFGFANGGIIKTHSDGDLITNGIPGKEYVLNSAQHGEFIVNAQSTKHHLGLLRAINSDKNGNMLLKQHSDGGTVDTTMNMDMGMGLNNGAFMNMLPSLMMYGNLLNTNAFKFLISPEKALTNMANNITNYDDLLKANRLQAKANSLEMRTLTKNSKAYNQIVEKNLKLEVERHNLVNQRNARAAKISKVAKGAKIVTGVAGTALAGFGSYASLKSHYEATGEAVLNKQKAQAGTIGGTIGGTVGAAAMAWAGPIGMAIGSYAGEKLGQWIGEKFSETEEEMHASKMEIASKMENHEGSNKFFALKGDFSTKEQKAIAEALSDGKLYKNEIKDKDLITKLEQTGNSNIFESHGRGGWLRGKPHTSGGIYMGLWNGRQHFGEGGEALISADKAKQSPTLINGIMEGRYNDMSIKPIEPMGKQMHVDEKTTTNIPSQPLNIAPINININGTIKLDANDKTFDISKTIFNDTTFIAKITDIITKQLNINEHFSLNRKQMRNKYSTL